MRTASNKRFLLGLALVLVAAAGLGAGIGYLLFHKPTVHVAAVHTALQPKVEVPPALAALTPLQKRIVRIAKTHGPGSGYIYRWGGTGNGYFDCSGYVQRVLQEAGIYGVPRTSQSMFAYVPTHVPGSQIRPGDVVFFVSYGGRTSPGHVGLAIGGGLMIEYYRTGFPARISLIDGHRDFLGGGRWWHIPHVPPLLASRAFWAARHFHVKIAWSAGQTVQFVPRNGWALVRWARGQRYTVHSRPGYVNVTFVKRPLPPLTPQQKLRRRTGYFSWLSWRQGRDDWKRYGKANPTVRPNVPRLIPKDWWTRRRLFLHSSAISYIIRSWGPVIYSDVLRQAHT